MTQSVRLFWRTARFEILAGLGLSLALTVAMLVVAGRLDAIRASACPGLRTCDDAAFVDLVTGFAEPLLFAASLISLVVGLLYGPALVGRELERRSAPLAWSLAPSRVRWLLWRAAPPAALVLLLLIGPALAGDRLEAASYSQFDPAQSFNDIESRGVLVVVRGLLAFGFGVAAGVFFGRTLPALLLAGGLCLGALLVASAVRPAWLPREAISLDEMNQATRAVPLFLSGGVSSPDGRQLLTDAESAPLRPPDAQDITSPGYDLWIFHSGWRRVFLGISGVHYREVELREAGSTGATALLAFGLGLLAVRRRRPVPGISLEPDARRGVSAPGEAVGAPRARWRQRGPWLSWLMTSRVGRPEVFGAVIAVVAVTGATLVVIKLLGDARVAQHCVDTECIGEGPFARVNNPLTDWLYPLLAALPFVVGGLLGGPVIARELETGTGRLTWSLTASRVRWLAWRIAPLLALTIVLLVPAALAGSALIHAQTLLDPTYYFADDHIRGAALVARGLATFGVGLLAGVLWRRTLSALIVTAVVGTVLYNGLYLMSGFGPISGPFAGGWLPPDVLGGVDYVETPGSFLLTEALEAPDGTFQLAYEVALAAGFPRLTSDGNLIELDPGFTAWYTARGYRYVTIGWDASRYPEFVLRESSALVGGAIGTICLAGLVLRSRRPG
jgi:hypothetical protein